jgi:hypothetical protein
MNSDYLKSLSDMIEDLEQKGFQVEANNVHNLFIKEANRFKKTFNVPFPKDLNKALDEFNSNYQVDSDGSWENAEPISDFREELSDADLHQPAAVDDNHIVFYNEDEKHVEVMNMIPKHHLDSLHKNPSDKTRFIKRAED